MKPSLHIFAACIAALMLVPSLSAQNQTARLDLEQSTDGLSSWQRVPLIPEMLNNGSIDLKAFSGSSFYRIHISTIPHSPPSANMQPVTGGILPQVSRFSGQTVSSFQIGKYEITWNEWKEVREWAISNGFDDLMNVGQGSAENHPVRNVNWYDVVKWCNAKSLKDNLKPVYLVNGVAYKYGIIKPELNSSANGYRLPTEKEWEWAARGGITTQGYIYSGSNYGNPVAWHFGNSIGASLDVYIGRGTWPVGQKTANELGIHDMSGNVWEWCEDSYSTTVATKLIRGGSFKEIETNCSVAYRYDAYMDVRFNDLGFRLARNAP